jgi:hypothetical protein
MILYNNFTVTPRVVPQAPGGSSNLGIRHANDVGI